MILCKKWFADGYKCFLTFWCVKSWPKHYFITLMHHDIFNVDKTRQIFALTFCICKWQNSGLSFIYIVHAVHVATVKSKMAWQWSVNIASHITVTVWTWPCSVSEDVHEHTVSCLLFYQWSRHILSSLYVVFRLLILSFLQVSSLQTTLKSTLWLFINDRDHWS